MSGCESSDNANANKSVPRRVADGSGHLLGKSSRDGGGAKDSHIAFLQQQNRVQSSCMTPSIITTINNATPAPAGTIGQYPPVHGSCAGAIGSNAYESYIEDSFVGHWETEEDDPVDESGEGDGHHRSEEDQDDDPLHPSTIEFDFDSFGPESFIYTPMPSKTTAHNEATSRQNNNDKDVDNLHSVAKKTAFDSTSENTSTPQSHEGLQQQKADSVDASPRELAGVTDDEFETIESLKRLNVDSTPPPQTPGETLVKKESLISTDEPPTRPELGEGENQLFDSRHQGPAKSAPSRQRYQPNPYDCLVDFAQIDLKVIEPYKKVISHAGYCHHFDASIPPAKPGEPKPAIIVFSACYLPDRSRRDYNYVMDHLFLYVLSSLHELIADDYILIYLHNTQPSNQTRNTSNGTGSGLPSASSSSTSPSTSSAAIGGGQSPATGTINGLISSLSGTSSSSGNDPQQPPNNLPTFTWMKRCYQMIDRRLRKNLRILYLVKPTFWLKTIVIMCKPFISSKFSKKLRFVDDMNGLRQCLPVDELILPASAENI